MARGGDGRFGMACGGDTFNTAVYLARAGIDVAYATALGDDPYSDGIVAMAAAEGIKTDLMLRVPGRLPGLYMIETDTKGERRFRYWRDEAPARELFELPDWNRIAESMMGARLIYFLRHHAVALFQHRARPLARRPRDGAPAGRQDRVRRQLPPARLEGRPAAHPHRVHGGAQARRHRAADLRRRGGAVGRSESRRRRSSACRRSASARSWSRTARTARWSRPADGRSSSRCRRSSSRSTPRRRATASTPAISRRGSSGENPAIGGRRRAPARRREGAATAARSCRATRAAVH